MQPSPFIQTDYHKYSIFPLSANAFRPKEYILQKDPWTRAMTPIRRFARNLNLGFRLAMGDVKGGLTGQFLQSPFPRICRISSRISIVGLCMSSTIALEFKYLLSLTLNQHQSELSPTTQPLQSPHTYVHPEVHPAHVAAASPVISS